MVLPLTPDGHSHIIRTVKDHNMVLPLTPDGHSHIIRTVKDLNTVLLLTINGHALPHYQDCTEGLQHGATVNSY